jgi:hypothetical protein
MWCSHNRRTVRSPGSPTPERPGKRLDPRLAFGHGVTVGKHAQQHRLHHLFGKPRRVEPRRQLGRRDRRQRVEIGIEVQKRLLGGRHHRARRRREPVGAVDRRPNRPQARHPLFRARMDQIHAIVPQRHVLREPGKQVRQYSHRDREEYGR